MESTLSLDDGNRILEPRKRPTQERSKRKFESILAASRQLLVEVGFESFTCAEVAERADVPIGTVYQYFANKYVIVCELDRQDYLIAEAELQRLQDEIGSLQWTRVLERFLGRVAEVWHSDPSRRAVWLAVQSTPATRATAAKYEKALADVVGRILTKLAGDPVKANVMAEVIIHTIYSMLNYSVQQDRREVITEMKQMIRSYLIHAALSRDV